MAMNPLDLFLALKLVNCLKSYTIYLINCLIDIMVMVKDRHCLEDSDQKDHWIN